MDDEWDKKFPPMRDSFKDAKENKPPEPVKEDPPPKEPQKFIPGMHLRIGGKTETEVHKDISNKDNEKYQELVDRMSKDPEEHQHDPDRDPEHDPDKDPER